MATFTLIPPEGGTFDIAKGERVAEAVFAANNTAPEIAVFGYRAAQRFERSKALAAAAGGNTRPGDPPTEQEMREARVFALAWASGLEACTGTQVAVEWQCEVVVPEGVFVRVPGASVEVVHRAMQAARDVFAAAGVTPQEAAMGQFEQHMYDVHGFQGPEPSPESSHAFGVFLDAERAAIEAGGSVRHSYLSIEGCDTPYWQERFRKSEVINWKGEEEPAAA
jgi:hypothetical protein